MPLVHEGGRGEMLGLPELRETLQLEGLASGSWRLTRTLTAPCGLQANVQALGQRMDDLLARVEAIAPCHQFHAGPGWLLARSYSADADATPLTRGIVKTAGLRLTLNVPEGRRMAGDIELTPTQVPTPSSKLSQFSGESHDASFGNSAANMTAKSATNSATNSAVNSAANSATNLPDDLLAVLGWSWARLVPAKPGWTSKLRLRGAPAQRTVQAERALNLCAAHLAQTLSEPPPCYHDRLRAARWRVVFRRAIPALTAVALVAAVAFLPHFETQGRPGLWMLMYHVPTALIALSFCLQELARFEIPPLPRRSTAARWQAGGGALAGEPVVAGLANTSANPVNPGAVSPSAVSAVSAGVISSSTN